MKLGICKTNLLPEDEVSNKKTANLTGLLFSSTLKYLIAVAISEYYVLYYIS